MERRIGADAGRDGPELHPVVVLSIAYKGSYSIGF
jgi:hypothetical protein